MTSPNDEPPGPRVLRRWPGVLLSLLIPGGGIFLGGDRRAGLCWFVGLNALEMLVVLTASLPLLPDLSVPVVLFGFAVIAEIWMLVRSYRPLDRLGEARWALVVLVGIALNAGGTAVAGRLTRPFLFPTGSMEPTIMPGDRVFVQMSRFWFRPPARGDIVVFKTDSLGTPLLPRGQFFAKRVAAVAGERVQIHEGRLVVNGQRLQGAGILSGTNFWANHIALLKTESADFLVPSNACFVIGDNATNSFDSRHYGAIPYAGIIGRVTKIYLPLSRAGDVR